MLEPEVLKYAAFSALPDGGNPAGVVLSAGELDEPAMQGIAAEVDFAETAFVTGVRGDGALRIRYFSPIAEVPFCGHATVATAIAFAERNESSGNEPITFATPVGDVVIAVSHEEQGIRAAFTSIPPSVRELTGGDLAAILRLIGLTADDIDLELPPRIAHAGNPHPVLVLADRETFDKFTFDPHEARALMDDRGWPATITIAHRVAPDRFGARNLFPVGRITEDPATGAAAAAFGAYLRDLSAVPVPSRIMIEQGSHVGRPGFLTVDIPMAGGIVVSGHAVPID
ncbi:PhzF family phenazine biosynthesis protein [Microbacterium sp. R86528]|uniref:PhzF family phenazine biosynthesis protein n=1 Tax=Microbacterium sp. R86528 TaxID=3093864 RepID=UPI0037CB9730